jgi:hypothetical protein
MPNDRFVIGNAFPTGTLSAWVGLLGRFRLYKNRVLTPTEVASLANNPLQQVTLAGSTTAATLTLPGGRTANRAVAGLNYVSTMTSMPIVPPTQEGTGQLKKASVPKSRFRVVNTLHMKAGQFTVPNPSGTPGLSSVRLGGEGPALDATVANTTPYSGYARSSILEALRDDCYLSVQSDLPLPCAVSAIVPDVEQTET